jgi:hypothetical protein
LDSGFVGGGVPGRAQDFDRGEVALFFDAEEDFGFARFAAGWRPVAFDAAVEFFYISGEL